MNPVLRWCLARTSSRTRCQTDGQPRHLEAALGSLEVRERGAVVLTLLGVDDAHALGTPEPRRDVRMGLLQLLGRGLDGVVAHVLERLVLAAAHELRKSVQLLRLD